MQDEIRDVLQIIELPIKSRSKLITGECKFVLTSSLLFKLNKVLDIIENDSVDIILSEGQRKTLETFLRIIGRIPKLVITQRCAESFDNIVDLRKFKHLRYLELVKVCLENIVGVDKLKTQLETFVCNRSTKFIEVVFNQKKLQWAELKCLDLRHSQISEIDGSFFNHLPWIQTLDLSCNQLREIDGLDSLDHLKCLNISFNFLEKFPSLSKEVVNTLEVLLLTNNQISSLSGFETLISLKSLDISSNWLTDKCELLYLSQLKALNHLNISNNPVSFLKYFRIYVAASLNVNINVEQFYLDRKHLTSHEQTVIGQKFTPLPRREELAVSTSTISTTLIARTPPMERKFSKNKKTGKRPSKVRKAVIEDISARGKFKKPVEEEIDIEALKNIPPYRDQKNNADEKEIALMKKLENIELFSPPEAVASCSQVEQIYSSPAENDLDFSKILISTTVHVHNECSGLKHSPVSSKIECVDESDIESEIREILETIIVNITSEKEEEQKTDINAQNSEIQNLETLNNGCTESIKSVETNNNNVALSEEDSEIEFSDIEDEIFWHVQRKDKVTGTSQNIILVLLERELKERSTQNNRTIVRWPLSTVISCTKTKTDPITVEIEFDSLKKDKRSRIYIMEFADAQVLLKKLYSILEAKPLSDMNQRTYKCIKCSTLFVHDTPSAFKSKGTLVSCPVCLSTLVVQVEEPRLPEPKDVPSSSLDLSLSQSSIGNDNIKPEEATSKEWKIKCSASSSAPSNFERKYESDIEIISNPSQSSVEVINEDSLSTTPRSRSSYDDKQDVTSPSIPTVSEVHSSLSNMTESSSSGIGSLTESVLTAYEAFNINKKKLSTDEILTEEETVSELQPPETIEVETPKSIWMYKKDIYSYTDFTDVDARVKLYVYETLFEDDNEELLMITKCHFWKTGGSDYDGCLVISNSNIYFLSHSRTNFKEDTCDWLTKFDRYNLKDVKEIAPMPWQLGARIQIKNFSYLVLLLDHERNGNFFKFLKGLSLKGIKIQNNFSSKQELSLQQAVLSSKSIDQSIDPTVNFFTICLSITILKDDIEEEFMRLGGLVITRGEFYLVPGELSWLTSSLVPTVVTHRQMSCLIEVEKGTSLVKLHFLDEKAAMEEVWSLKCSSDVQVSSIVDAIRTPWEERFAVGLEVTNLK